MKIKTCKVPDNRLVAHPNKPAPGEDPRADFVMVRCCSNCKYYIKGQAHGSVNRGVCVYPSQSVNKFKKKHRHLVDTTNRDGFLYFGLPTYGNCRCNHWQRDKNYKRFKSANYWCGVSELEDV